MEIISVLIIDNVVNKDESSNVISKEDFLLMWKTVTIRIDWTTSSHIGLSFNDSLVLEQNYYQE